VFITTDFNPNLIRKKKGSNTFIQISCILESLIIAYYYVYFFFFEWPYLN